MWIEWKKILAIGAELIKIQNVQPRVLSYGSFALTPEQRRYCNTRKGLLAVIRFTQPNHYLYILGISEYLGQYDMTVVHCIFFCIRTLSVMFSPNTLSVSIFIMHKLRHYIFSNNFLMIIWWPNKTLSHG